MSREKNHAYQVRSDHTAEDVVPPDSPVPGGTAPDHPVPDRPGQPA